MIMEYEVSRRSRRRRLGWGGFAACWMIFLLLAVFRGDAMAPIHHAEKVMAAHGRFARHNPYIPPGPGANFILVRWYERMMKKIAPDYVERRALDNSYYNIEVSDPKTGDGLLKTLHNLPRVHELKLYAGSYSKDGISHIVSLQGLAGLAIDVSELSDEDVGSIGTIPSLKWIEVNGILTAPKAISVIGQMKNLKRLKIRDVITSNGALAKLGRLTSIERLSLTLSPDVDQLSDLLSGMTRLRYLTLRRAGSGDLDLTCLNSLPHLQALVLNGTGFSDESIKHVAGMKTLTTLDLSDTSVGNGVAKLLTDSPQLQYIDLSSTQVGDVAMRCLTISPSPQNRLQWNTLNLNSTRITGDCLKHLVGIPLTTLHVSNCPNVSAGVPSLTQMPQLQWLSVAQTDVQLDELKQLRRLPKLNSLNVSGTEIGSSGLREIGMFPNVTRLYLRDMTISSADLEFIMTSFAARNLISTSSIALGTETGLTSDDLSSLRLRYPTVKLW